jgi:hypothetical protein
MAEKVPPANQPRLQELLTHFLRAQHQLPELPMSEVELYQAQPALGLELTLAWSDGLLPGRMLSDSSDWQNQEMPTEWAQQARTLSWSAPFPCCVGLAPQFLQHISSLLQDSEKFFRTPLRFTTQTTWPTSKTASLASQLASARLCGQNEHVTTALDSFSDPNDITLKQNEKGAQEWLQGNYSQAEKIWQKLPAEQPVVAFNQSLACLQRGDVTAGIRLLSRASQGISNDSGWHHLAELYLAALRAES